jgi:pimeloyl-ACP methyl ester carboxylesterase
MFKVMYCCLALLIPVTVLSQKIPYGNNPQAGHYFNVGDARIYYETYGKGEPFVLLHGGVYGYIDEFEYIIPKLAEKYQVICIATRGHGKPEIGNTPFTYQQRAEDCFKVIRNITKDSVTVLGFSDGGYSGLKLAALYPDVVKKLIAIGVGDKPKDSVYNKYHYTVAELKKASPKFIESRMQLMPEPDRYDECLAKLNDLYNKDYMSKETFSTIQCPGTGNDRRQRRLFNSRTSRIMCEVYTQAPVVYYPRVPSCGILLQLSGGMGIDTTVFEEIELLITTTYPALSAIA